MHAMQGFMQALRMQHKVQNKRNRTRSNLMQAMQEVADDMAGIYHVKHCMKPCIVCIT